MKVKRVWLLAGVAAVVLSTGILGYWKYSRGTVASPGHPLVFYDEDGSPTEQSPALSRLEINKILDCVAAQTQDPVWLIWVRPSQIYDVYIVPEKTTPRMRVGRMFGIRKSEPAASIGSGGTYMQVCAPGCTFRRRLTKPCLDEMPFAHPTVVDPNSGQRVLMSEKDILDVVDFVRQQSNLSRSLNLLQVAKSLPVLDIHKEGQIIFVQLGFMHDALWGHGITIQIECVPTGYKVVSWDQWIS